MIDLSQQEVWFVTGSQRPYGEETLQQVAANLRSQIVTSSSVLQVR